MNISPAFVVPKQGQLLGRMVVDYKRINGITEKTVWKRALHNFAHLEGKEPYKFYFASDAKAGFFQVRLSERASRLLAFSVGEGDRGAYRPTRLPFGPKNGPAEFQRRVETIWLEKGGHGQWYMDDLSWYAGGGTREEAFRNGLRTLQENLRARREGGATLEIRKTQLFQEEIKLLGFYFEKDGKKVTETKAAKLAKWRVETVKGIVGFLAFINYLREFYDPRVLTRCGKALRAYVREGR